MVAQKIVTAVPLPVYFFYLGLIKARYKYGLIYFIIFNGHILRANGKQCLHTSKGFNFLIHHNKK